MQKTCDPNGQLPERMPPPRGVEFSNTFKYNQSIIASLLALGIRVVVRKNIIHVDCNSLQDSSHRPEYSGWTVIAILRTEFPGLFITWGGKTDRYMQLSVQIDPNKRASNV